MDGLVVLFQGSRGSGKTLSLIVEALLFLKEGWEVFANFKTPFSKYISDVDIFNLNKDSKLKNCVLLIDEMQIFFDSRLWSSKKSIGFSNFVQQLRKRNIILMGTTQYVDTVEKRIRQHVDLLIKPDYNEDYEVCHCIVYDLTSLEDSNDLKSYEYFFYAKPIFELYDTFEIL